MKANTFALSVLTLAVQGALMTMVAMPVVANADDEVTAADQANPTNSVEIGGIYTSKDSAKFGEYNGLNEQGVNAIVNFNLRGGDGYGMGTGTTRWSLIGSDLGTDSRELGATISNQGQWSLGIDYDQLRHNISDTYQTPYMGSAGSNNFTLPSDFARVSNATSLNSTNQLPAFHTPDVHSQRENTSFKAGYNFDSQWGVTFDYNHLQQSGAKLISSATEADSTSTPTYSAERLAILMNPTESHTDTFNLALNWKGDKAYFSGGYYGSLYHDDYSGLTWANPFAGATVSPFMSDTMSTPPSNQFHQLNLSGGYTFSPATHLTGGYSYARNTQNQSYAGSFTPGYYDTTGPASLDGKVIMTHANLKLTHQATKDLNLSAGVIYNERNNKTATNEYFFAPIANDPGDYDPVYNAPMSYKHTQYELAGNYKIDDRQRLNLAYNRDEMKRWCNNSLANSNSINTDATSCAQVPKNTEDKLAIDYKLNATDAVTMKFGYSYGNRKADKNEYIVQNTGSNLGYYNAGFYNPMQAIPFGESSPGYELAGYTAFFQDSRKENQLNARLNWEASQQLSFGISGKYQKDDYDATYGTQKGDRSSINLDATYSYSDNNQVSAFATWQNRTRDLLSYQPRNNGSSYSAGTWFNSLTDKDVTLGISGKQKGMLGGKFDLSEDLTYSIANTDYTTTLGTATYASPNNSKNSGAWPTIKSEVIQLKLGGSYKLDKASKILAGYMYQHLKADDYSLYVYQYGTNYSAQLPTNQGTGSYNQNVVYVAYSHSFK